ncbi:hypothetical protein [Mesorhizobium dulcispinae]|nr:hypothetical protein [Mesorhizobium sp. VK23D]MDX8521820.1 hypothetical protein [Mesorhizobium sp. VK23D]
MARLVLVHFYRLALDFAALQQYLGFETYALATRLNAMTDTWESAYDQN